MDVGLNSEQLSLRATVRDILRTECPPDVARQALDDAGADPDRWRTLWKTVVDLGWTELAAPSEEGADEYGPVELFDSGYRILLADIESGELCGPRSRAESQVESAARRVGQGDGLLGEHCGMPERVAQDEVPDP